MTDEEYRLLALECVVAATANPDKAGGIARSAMENANRCVLNSALHDKDGFSVDKLQSYVEYLLKGNFGRP